MDFLRALELVEEEKGEHAGMVTRGRSSTAGPLCAAVSFSSIQVLVQV